MGLSSRPYTDEYTDENSAEEISEQVVASLNHILKQAVSSRSPHGSIYKVPEPLRSSNPEAFTPAVISIGPFHSGNKDLMANSLKPIFLQHFLYLTNHTTTTIVEEVVTWEEKARGCYAEPIGMRKNEFVQLLVLDGCFVVMHLIGCWYSEFEVPNTSDLWKFWQQIYYDMLLLENQLPFFLLQFLYHLFASSQPSVLVMSFIEIAHQVFIPFAKKNGLFSDEVLLGDIGTVDHIVDFQKKHFTPTGRDEKWILPTCWPPTASELHECGVIFKTGKNIAFDDQGGFLELPQINISDDFEKLMKNLLAYEQCQCAIHISKEVSNFAVFMQCLVQTDQDVKLLLDEGIIENNLGSIKELTQLFNVLCKYIDPGVNYYHSECNKMREYCKHRRHRWMTSLYRNYFSTPWLCASSIGVILILVLTFIQTVMSVLSFLKDIRLF